MSKEHGRRIREAVSRARDEIQDAKGPSVDGLREALTALEEAADVFDPQYPPGTVLRRWTTPDGVEMVRVVGDDGEPIEREAP